MAPTFNVITPLTYVLSTRYVQVASMTLVLYDHILTFREEVDFVWRGVHPRSWPRLLFLTARYAPVIAILANSSALLNIRHSENVEVGFFFTDGRDIASSLLFRMRLWAMYRSRMVFLAMTIVIILALVAMGTIEGLGYRNLKVTTAPAGGLVHICGPGPLPHYVYTFWLPPLLIETTSVTLVVYKAMRHFQTGAPKEWAGSRFISSIVRYSVIYFVVVLIVYIANFYVWLRLPVPAFELFVPLTFALPSVAGNRMLLSLRGVFYDDHAELPGPDNIGLMVVNPDRGLIIETHNPLKEFESFFGENKSIK